MPSKTASRTRENLLRRMADRQGLKRRKTRRFDPLIDYGTFALLDGPQMVDAAGTSLGAIEAYLTAGWHRLAGKEVRRS